MLEEGNGFAIVPAIELAIILLANECIITSAAAVVLIPSLDLLNLFFLPSPHGNHFGGSSQLVCCLLYTIICTAPY